MPASPRAPRIERILRRGAEALFAALVLLGAPFVLGYRSADPAIGPWTLRYLAGVLAPFGVLALGAILLTVTGRRRGVAPGGGARAGALLRPRERAGLLPSTLGRLPGPVALLLAAASVVAAGVWALSISDEYVSVLMFLLAVPFLGLVWDRAFGDVDPLVPSLILLVGGVALFGIELASLLLPGDAAGGDRDDRPTRPVLTLAVWGDTSTFATLFPREAPFIGPGGRLRPNLDVRMRAPEYRNGARLVTNARGFRNEEEFAPEPAAGEIRILSLGDSFSTGFCADQRAFFGSVLQEALRERMPGRSVRVMNAEVSDPAYGLRYLQEHGMGYRPAVVLYGLSGNDIMQAEQFYGPDKLFALDARGRLVANPEFDPAVKSAWERYADFAYPAAGTPDHRPPGLLTEVLAKLIRFRALSGLAILAAGDAARPADMPGYAGEIEKADGRKRLVDGAANLGFFYLGEAGPVERMYAAFEDLLPAIDRTAREGGARFVLLLHPQRYQVQPADWEAIRARWNLEEAAFDLRLMNDRIARLAEKHRIPLCDPVNAFAGAAREGSLYLPGGDTHYNRRGHRVAGRAAAACLEALDLF